MGLVARNSTIRSYKPCLEFLGRLKFYFFNIIHDLIFFLMFNTCHVIIHFFEVSKEGAPLVFKFLGPLLKWIKWLTFIIDYKSFFHLSIAISNWFCPSILSRFARCYCFLALRRTIINAHSQLSCLGFLDYNSTNFTLWAFLLLPLLFIFIGLVESWANALPNMIFAK